MNIRLASSLAVALLAAPFGAAFGANDGTIEITGRITSTTCEVEGKPPGTGAATKNVELHAISAAYLTAEGQTSGDRGFNIRIGGNAECTDGELASIRFDPASPALDRASGRLNIDGGADAAKNVQIEIANGDGTPINMYTQDSYGVTIDGHTAVIPLIARYYSTGKAESGSANSRIGFQVVYQ